jgi:hypothetical protein
MIVLQLQHKFKKPKIKLTLMIGNATQGLRLSETKAFFFPKNMNSKKQKILKTFPYFENQFKGSKIEFEIFCKS